MTDLRLEDELADLGVHLDVDDGAEAARGAARAVSARLSARPAVSAVPRWRRKRTWIPVAVAVAVTGVVASPAVGDWFGIRGVEVVRRSPTPTMTTTTAVVPAGATLDLGRPSNLAEAAKVLGRPPMVPAALGPPHAVWLDAATTTPFVTLVYGDGGPLVSEFDATLTPAPILTKFVESGTTVEELRVDGHRALWIDGIHEVVLQDRTGALVPERLRVSSSVLLVDIGGLTVRIETPAGRDEAVRIAGSLRP